MCVLPVCGVSSTTCSRYDGKIIPLGGGGAQFHAYKYAWYNCVKLENLGITHWAHIWRVRFIEMLRGTLVKILSMIVIIMWLVYSFNSEKNINVIC